LMDKVVLRFPDVFWDPSVFRIHHISNIKGEFPWFDNCKDNEPILLSWIACSYAEKLEEKSDEEIVANIMSVLRKIFKDKEIPEPVEYEITRWNLDPFSHGSWSGK
jgi:monoamine oxidase